MRDSLIERAKAALDGVTDGPWMWSKESGWVVAPVDCCTCCGPPDGSFAHERGCGLEPVLKPSEAQTADAEFIAAARSLVPELVAALEVQLPEPDGPLGYFGEVAHGLAWRLYTSPEGEDGGIATVATIGIGSGQVAASISCISTPDDARWAAFALLAAANAAETTEGER